MLAATQETQSAFLQLFKVEPNLSPAVSKGRVIAKAFVLARRQNSLKFDYKMVDEKSQMAAAPQEICHLCNIWMYF